MVTEIKWKNNNEKQYLYVIMPVILLFSYEIAYFIGWQLRD